MCAVEIRSAKPHTAGAPAPTQPSVNHHLNGKSPIHWCSYVSIADRALAARIRIGC